MPKKSFKRKIKKKSYKKSYKKSKKIQKIKYLSGSGISTKSCAIKDFDECTYGTKRGKSPRIRNCKYNFKNQICQPA